MRVPWQLAKIFSPYINEIQGQENIPINQFILASNHLSPIDSVLAILAVRRKVVFVAERRLLQNWLFRFVVFFIGQSIPNSTDENITLYSSKLQHGKTVALFIQGDIHPKYKKNNRIHTGAIVLSQLTQIPIVPMKVENLDKVWPLTYWPLRFWKVKSINIKIGKPIIVPKEIKKDEYQKRSNDLYKKIIKF